jgi:hypothetical protein
MGPLLTGALAGAAGGIAGTIAMNYTQRLWTIAADRERPTSAAGKHDARDWQERDEGRNSNEIAAQALASATIGRRLTRRELAIAASVLHFGFGAAMGALHGLRAETACRRPSGVIFGTTIWLCADEIAMPAVGLSESTLKRPIEMHIQSLIAHLVYGIVGEHVRRFARRRIPASASAQHIAREQPSHRRDTTVF